MRHLLKPIIFSIFAITLVLSAKHFAEQDLVLERTKKGQEKWEQMSKDVEDIKSTMNNSGILYEAKKDFSHFVSMVKDFKKFTRSGESKYSSGFEAIRGTETTGDSSVDIFQDIIAAKEDSPLEKVILVHVVDGDTISVIADDGFEYRVRLIGIDTPESVNTDESKNNEFGTLASDHTKYILDSIETLYLEYDKEYTDSYGRVLAYVWLSEDRSSIINMLNAKILEDGYAVDKVYKPNDRYSQVFRDIRLEAESRSAGLWEYDGYKEIIGD